MGWTTVELADIIEAFDTGNHQAVATLIAAMFDRETKRAVADRVEAAAVTAAQTNAALLHKLSRTPTLTGPIRDLDTSFQVSATDPAWVSYTVREVVTSALLSTHTINVALLVDEFDPPTTIVGVPQNSLNQTLGLTSIGLTVDLWQQVSGWVPAAHYVSLKTSGDSTASVISSTEWVFSG